VQSIVAKYLDPTLQCRVIHRQKPDTDDRYPIIMVPGGHRVPVRAKTGSPDGSKLVPHRAYIRRPGPCSEEPKTAEEWDRLIERCVQARQSELLEAMRSIMAGVIPAAESTQSTRVSQLIEFANASIDRWVIRTASVAKDAAPLFPNGHYDVAIAIDGAFDAPTLASLRTTISTAVRNHSGWPPFLTLNRPPFQPKPADGAVECWCGPDSDGHLDVPAHHDFWRVSPNGFLFTRRGYAEDGGFKGSQPGTTFDVTTTTWRIGEAILEAAYIARALNADQANLICRINWTGLRGRRLVSVGNPNRMLWSVSVCEQDVFEANQTIALAAIPQALPEIVFALIEPLYELFGFFQLPKRLVEEELINLQSRTFAV
jgi:hypothetical protein